VNSEAFQAWEDDIEQRRREHSALHRVWKHSMGEQLRRFQLFASRLKEPWGDCTFQHVWNKPIEKVHIPLRAFMR
jgi:hypothetical protein